MKKMRNLQFLIATIYVKDLESTADLFLELRFYSIICDSYKGEHFPHKCAVASHNVTNSRYCFE